MKRTYLIAACASVAMLAAATPAFAMKSSAAAANIVTQNANSSGRIGSNALNNDRTIANAAGSTIGQPLDTTASTNINATGYATALDNFGAGGGIRDTGDLGLG